METLNAQCLAYLGDAVFELYVRAMLTREGNRPVGKLNRVAKSYVSAEAQSAMYKKIYDLLTDEEQSLLKRGRNLNPTTRAKHADMSDYRHATGLETLFGYLFHEGRHERLNEIFALCANANENNIKK